MHPVSCLADIRPEKVATFVELLAAAGAPVLPAIAHIDVVELRKLAPAVLVCDIDAVDGDALETLRQVRFVLPACIIVVYTAVTERGWGLACHLAGANGMLSKDATDAELLTGLAGVLRNGCYTDPRFAAA